MTSRRHNGRRLCVGFVIVFLRDASFVFIICSVVDDDCNNTAPMIMADSENVVSRLMNNAAIIRTTAAIVIVIGFIYYCY